MRKATIRIVTIFIGVGFALALGAQGQETFKARLSPVAADARTRKEITGIGSVTGMLTGSKLTITGSFEGLHSPATIAQLRQGVVRGARGPVILDLMVAKGANGSISGSFDLTPQQVESLKEGRLYVQIDSEGEKDGNLWGWLLP
ncbi:MAG TPA: CHRD domain-containing protein [Bryobacteraceae bacterium]|nr:CHRD domain-containing protein [Bryobacteraceae bacterium]